MVEVVDANADQNSENNQQNTPLNTSFLRRQLRVQITLYKGEFADGSNTKIIENLATTCSIQKLAYPEGGKASVEIIGLPLADMEALTTLSFKPMYVKRNYINIFAGDELHGLNQVFAGTITKAGADFNSSPEVKFKMEAAIGFYGRMTAQGPNVVSGSQSAASFIEGQCKKAGFKFTNQDVSAQIKDCVFQGSPIQQAQQCANQIGAELILDDGEAVLMKTGDGRKGNAILLNKDSGLLGYPTISQNGVEVKAIFNPDFKFAGLFKLETIVPKASGTWRITKLTHKLAANSPSDGSWESSITGFYPAMSGASGKWI